MVVRIVSGRPRLGYELEYILALKHRDGWSRLINRTPWYQFKKRQRRNDGWIRAVNRFHQFGQDLIYQRG